MLSRTMFLEPQLLAASCPSLTRNVKDGAASSVAMQGWASPRFRRLWNPRSRKARDPSTSSGQALGHHRSFRCQYLRTTSYLKTELFKDNELCSRRRCRLPADILNPLGHATSLSLADSFHFAIVPSWPAHPVFAE